MTAPPTPAAPEPVRLVGRTTNRVLLAGFVLSLAATVFLMVQNSDSFLSGLVVTAFFGLLLAGLPAALFLINSWRRQPPDVPPLTRRYVYASGASLAIMGGMYAWGSLAGEDKTPVAGMLGVLVAIVGVAAIVRLWRFTSPSAPVAQLTYGRSSAVGMFFVVLIAIMIPKFACGCGSKRDAYRAAVKSDLRFLVMAEEAYFSDSLRYATNRELGAGYRASSGDSIEVEFADDKGFRALGWHMNLPDVRCGVWVGVAPPDGMHGADEAEPTCWKVK